MTSGQYFRFRAGVDSETIATVRAVVVQSTGQFPRICQTRLF